MEVFAIKDRKTGLFYNRVHKDLRNLSQNTAFYKTENGAYSEIKPSVCSRHMGFVQQKVLYASYIKENKIRTSWDYQKIDEYREAHRNDIDLEIVKIQICEAI